MIDEEKLVLVWMQTLYTEDIGSVDTGVYMALRRSIRQYNLDERAAEISFRTEEVLMRDLVSEQQSVVSPQEVTDGDTG